jgi:hypothetical protein
MHKPTPPIAIQLPTSLKEPCLGPDVSKVTTIQDLAKASIDQEAVIVVCEIKRKSLVELIEGTK